MLLRWLKIPILTALAAPTVVFTAGCEFDAWTPEPAPTDAIFCNVPKGRICARSQGDIDMAIRLDKQDEEGFWALRSSKYGLDYSPDAVAACGGMPQLVIFEGALPEGSPSCLDADDQIGEGVDSTGLPKFADVAAACQGWCEAQDFTDSSGGEYNCALVTPAHRAETPFRDACTNAGMLDPGFMDPRRLPPLQPVVWRDAVNVIVSGATIEKSAATMIYDAGASAERTLAPGLGGIFEFTVFETDRERVAGFAPGAPPDNDPSEQDIAYALVLGRGGVLQVKEHQVIKLSSTYATDDRLRIAVLSGEVYYYKNSQLLYKGTLVDQAQVHRITVSLRDYETGRGATIKDAATTF